MKTQKYPDRHANEEPEPQPSALERIITVMPIRAFKLTLEFSYPEIFYHWNYDPELPNIGGATGSVLPHGSVKGIGYDQLRALGEGTHSVQFDELTHDDRGRPPYEYGQDDKLFFRARYALFQERNHCCVMGEPHSILLETMSPGNVSRIAPLLSDSHIKKLRKYAKYIADTKAERDQQEHSIFCSSGTSTRIPDENLRIIREYFGPKGLPPRG